MSRTPSSIASLKVLKDPCALILSDAPSSSTLVPSSPVPPKSATHDLDTITEELSFSNDCEVNPDAHLHQDGAESDRDKDLDPDDSNISLLKNSFASLPPPPPSVNLGTTMPTCCQVGCSVALLTAVHKSDRFTENALANTASRSMSMQDRGHACIYTYNCPRATETFVLDQYE